MNYFEPSSQQARGLREAMDRALWESVHELLIIGKIGTSPSGTNLLIDPLPRATCLLDYSAYFDLDSCLRLEHRADARTQQVAVAHLQQRLIDNIPVIPVPAPPHISNFDTAHYTPEELQRISRWWDTEPSNRMALTAVSDEEFSRSCAAIEKAMHFLHQAAPELHGETQIIVRDIVLAKPDGTNLINYSGASSFGLWGAITINAETQCDWTQFYRQIVHETGHNLLFAIARDEPLVKAGPSVRRQSPIRADPRPLDGIFHAAYVSAREAAAFEALLQWQDLGGDLPQDDVDIISDMLELSVQAFWECVQTLRIDEDGPTDLGVAILADCEAYVKENFALEPLLPT